MAKLTTTSDITAISGKMSKKDSIYHRTSRRTGKIQVVAYSKERMMQRPTSPRQRQSRDAFIQRNKEASQWYQSIKPTPNNPGNPAEWNKLMQAFNAQHQYDNPYIFAIKYFLKHQLHSAPLYTLP